MAVLDKKGRLFGIINIIDLLVLVIIGAILIIGISRMGRGSVSSAQTTKAVVTYEVSDVRQVTIDQIQIGDPIYHYDKGTYIGEITNVTIEPFRERLDYNGRWIEADVPRKFVALVEVTANLTENDEYYLAGGEQTRVGIQYRLKNKKFASFGVVLNIEEME